MEPRRRCSVLFRGNVQGVGFRYTAYGVASGFSVTGYVRNLRDGAVELVAEGTEKDVSILIQSVLARMQGNVRDHTETWREATGEFHDFSIRR